MDVYIYQADLYCANCGEKIKTALEKNNPLHWPATQTDSDSYPQGPYPDGGGEADCPRHCDKCGCFLQNPLTSAGYDYVQKALQQHLHSGSECIGQWFEYYNFFVKSSETE
ncbi:hypothetical protein LCGC14_1722200 [marine sediment metagenome]|uniref:Uncharacterized protein n=1 Tax=marine sediment metagenome TaxID=412755 RepID=A0A0F9HZT6_9ZZZZ